MKSKFTVVLLALLLATSCGTTKKSFLPSSDKIDVNEYGSFIRLNFNTGPPVRGELIAISKTDIVVLDDHNGEYISIPLSEAKNFKLRYANSKNYGWTIPASMLASILHGYLSILTMPVNLVVTISVATSGESDFQYNDRNMSYEKLKMFARFPQGIPENIDIKTIKRNAVKSKPAKYDWN